MAPRPADDALGTSSRPHLARSEDPIVEDLTPPLGTRAPASSAPRKLQSQRVHCPAPPTRRSYAVQLLRPSAVRASRQLEPAVRSQARPQSHATADPVRSCSR